MSKRQIKNTLKKANKTKKVGRKGERKGMKKGDRKGMMKTKKNRISFKKMSKRKLKSTLKKAKRKIHKQLKYISMKGGAGEGKDVKMHKEVPQDPNQSEESIESTKAAAEVSNQANIFNDLKPNVVESFSGMSVGEGSVFSSQPFSLAGGAKMPKPMKRLRKTMKKRLQLIKKHKK